jgi:hypothetical protein
MVTVGVSETVASMSTYVIFPVYDLQVGVSKDNIGCHQADSVAEASVMGICCLSGGVTIPEV